MTQVALVKTRDRVDGVTRAVMERKGNFRLAEELGLDVVVFDEIGADGWEVTDVPGSHWNRVAIDAVGVAILRHFGTTRTVRRGPIFQQQQIARAVELGVGVSNPAQIEVVTPDGESEAYAVQIREILARG